MPGGKEVKISQYADDNTCIVTNSYGHVNPCARPPLVLIYIYGYIPIRPYKIEIQITTGDESELDRCLQ